MNKHRPKLVVCLTLIFLLLLVGLLASMQSGGFDSMTAALIGSGQSGMSPISYAPILLFVGSLLFAIFYLEKN